MDPIVEQLQHMSEERFLAIYEALSDNGFGPLDGEVARSLRFRPQAIRKLPMEKRARQARRIVETGSNAEMAYELFGSYLVSQHRELVTGFLDETGVPHEDGMIDLDDASPAEDKLDGALAKLDGEHDPEDVTLYLALCASQWPEMAALRERLAARAGASA
jgi:hypothetical protein